MNSRPSPPSHEIVVAETESEVQQCYGVRIAVFVDEQKFPLDTEIDHLDPTATHLLLRLTPSLEPIGTIRVSNHGDYYKLSRLAVLQGYRQYGFGRELVQALHAWVEVHARASGGGEVALVSAHSQIPVKSFYSKFGYEAEGAEFEEDGAPHQKMVLRLTLRD